MRTPIFVLLALALLVVMVAPVAAQEPDPTAPNRANVYTFVEYFRNHNMTELLPVLNADSYIGYNPFTPEGYHSTPEEAIPGEIEMNNAFDLDITSYLVLAEGDETALIAYQEADFTGELFDTAPTGEHFAGQIFFLTEYDDGLALSDIEVWNQVEFLQFMGWAPVEYTFDTRPWAVRLGSTSTTATEHHQIVQAMWDALANGDSAAIADAYAEDVVTHDYLSTLEGIEPTVAMYDSLIGLPGFTIERSGIVCEGDLCASAAVTSVTAADPADEDGKVYILWSALHRFVDGKIVEEWWLYDNAALWTFIPPNI
jgi:ketosteroid isomerase-like protein